MVRLVTLIIESNRSNSLVYQLVLYQLANCVCVSTLLQTVTTPFSRRSEDLASAAGDKREGHRRRRLQAALAGCDQKHRLFVGWQDTEVRQLLSTLRACSRDSRLLCTKHLYSQRLCKRSCAVHALAQVWPLLQPCRAAPLHSSLTSGLLQRGSQRQLFSSSRCRAGHGRAVLWLGECPRPQQLGNALRHE